MHREEPVLIPGDIGVEGHALGREPVAVVRDDLALDRDAHRRRHRVAHGVHDVAHPRRPAHDGPVEEAGAITIDEEVPDVRVAVHERARTAAEQLHDLVSTRQIQRGERMERVVHLVTECVDGTLDEGRRTADRAHRAPQPTRDRRPR